MNFARLVLAIAAGGLLSVSPDRPAAPTPDPVWHASWIEASRTNAEGATMDECLSAGCNSMPLFRKEFRLEGDVKRAFLFVSGLGQYEFRVNGAKVSDNELTPGWSDYRKTIFYERYDVTSMLHSGTNALGIMLGNGMYRVLRTGDRYTKFTGSFGPPKCIAQLRLELANGKNVEITTDG